MDPFAEVTWACFRKNGAYFAMLVGRGFNKRGRGRIIISFSYRKSLIVCCTYSCRSSRRRLLRTIANAKPSATVWYTIISPPTRSLTSHSLEALLRPHIGATL
ncbi:MAG: hypothetical protein MJE68_15775, partial [Proteobacteria bacterium]|nr:hypothetical protein [Pseudomonadota bacterium]